MAHTVLYTTHPALEILHLPGMQFVDPAKLNLKKVRRVLLGQRDIDNTCVGGWSSVDDLFNAVGGEGCTWTGIWKNEVKYVNFDEEANVAVVKAVMISRLFENTPAFAFLNIRPSQVDSLALIASVLR